MRKLALFASIMIGAAPAAFAQPAAAPAQATIPDAAERIIIHAGSLLDRPGRPPRRNATIIVANGRIEAVQDGFAAVPAGARLIDLSDRFVMPGLIDSHVHLTSDRAGVEGVLSGVTDSAALRAHETAWNAR